jgi:hypothetical protein
MEFERRSQREGGADVIRAALPGYHETPALKGGDEGRIIEVVELTQHIRTAVAIQNDIVDIRLLPGGQGRGGPRVQIGRAFQDIRPGLAPGGSHAGRRR